MGSVSFSAPGTLVRARGREWLVLPQSTDEQLMVRPLGGLDEECTAILPAIESVESASFQLPTRQDQGDFASGRLLRDAARLSTRAAAGPFRCFGRIAVEPRSYQLVPLMMGLKLDPVRLLIADDVGIGKTVESLLLAREMLDRGEITRMAVLCPPHLAEQWQKEMAEKFHIEAELVLSSTIQRLERDLPVGVSVFRRFPFTIVSTDFIKSERHALDFVTTCPEFVIVDEAHTCTLAGGVGRGRQQRHDLVRRISADKSRHIVLVTATPHSGNESAFRSLLGLLNPDFNDLPIDLDRVELETTRKELARHLVQRRRADILHYLDQDTRFPKRVDEEHTYRFNPESRRLFSEILDFAQELVTDESGTARHQRVRFWSALALLRCVSSSPAAAAATLRNRAAVDEADDDQQDAVGRDTVLDEVDDSDVTLDFNPGSTSEEDSESVRRRLLDFARKAEELTGDKDNKLKTATTLIKKLIDDGHHPLIFCRFIDTAEYVAKHLSQAVKKDTRVEVVTGNLPHSEREARIQALSAEKGRYVLVCTDCLSEGINLQDAFDAVFHYDLSWNPTRHEQREGRVDRFGQNTPQVRVITYYGEDNAVDGMILEVLIRKHKQIRNDLGVTVVVPGASEQVAKTLLLATLLRKGGRASQQLNLDLRTEGEFDTNSLHKLWDLSKENEKKRRTRFAQFALKPEEVDAELKRVRSAIGSSGLAKDFLHRVLLKAQVPVVVKDQFMDVHISPETPRAFRQAIGLDDPFKGRTELPLGKGEIYLGRTSQVVEGLAGWVLDQALDPAGREGRLAAARCGVFLTTSVAQRTLLLVVRFRYQLQSADDTLLAEEIVPLACTGNPPDLVWLEPKLAEELLATEPEGNAAPTLVDQQLERLEHDLPHIRTALSHTAGEHAALQLAAHRRVRDAARARGRMSMEAVLPPDILGAYILMRKI